MYALGPMIQWLVFQDGSIRAEIKAKKYRLNVQHLNMNKQYYMHLAILKPLQCIKGRNWKRWNDKKALNVNQHAVRLAKTSYEDGEDDILRVVDVERELVDIERELVIAQTRAVSLYKGLGGSWKSFDIAKTKEK